MIDEMIDIFETPFEPQLIGVFYLAGLAIILILLIGTMRFLFDRFGFTLCGNLPGSPENGPEGSGVPHQHIFISYERLQ